MFVKCALVSQCSVFERTPLWAAPGEIIELFFLFMWQPAFPLIQEEKHVLKLLEEQREAVRAQEHTARKAVVVGCLADLLILTGFDWF